MNTHTSASQSGQAPSLTAAIIRRFIQLAAYIVIQAALLFAASGRPDWLMAWIYLGLYVGGIALLSVVLLPRSPELVAERSQIKENAKGWDRVLTSLYGVIGLSILVVAGLDLRFGWSPHFPDWLEWVGVVVILPGWALLSWAMISNRFFSGVVRIQTDRGHTVVSGGPYQFVRHPGYGGMIIAALATAAMLGSWWAFIPTGLLLCLIVVRTALEDRTLQNELAGYQAYAARVRYRLVPGVW